MVSQFHRPRIPAALHHAKGCFAVSFCASTPATAGSPASGRRPPRMLRPGLSACSEQIARPEDLSRSAAANIACPHTREIPVGPALIIHDSPVLPEPYPYISRSVLYPKTLSRRELDRLNLRPAGEGMCRADLVGGLSWTRSGLQSWESGTVPVRCCRGSNTTDGRARRTRSG